MIELKNISKKFGQRLAVDDLTLEVPAGEIYGLLGHNGAGKSTAVGMMLGQVWPTSGRSECLTTTSPRIAARLCIRSAPSSKAQPFTITSAVGAILRS